MIKIAASTCPCPEDKQLEYALLLQKSGLDYLHCDVVDGKFASYVRLSVDKVKELSYGCLLLIDVHLMVQNTMEEIKKYLNADVNIITIQYESFNNNEEVFRAIKKIKSENVLAGISIKPETPVEAIYPFLSEVFLIMALSVKPGKSGQEFITSTFDKFKKLNEFRKANKLNFKIQADGGVNTGNIAKLKKLGVDIAVVGSALYNAKNKKEYIQLLKSAQ